MANEGHTVRRSAAEMRDPADLSHLKDKTDEQIAEDVADDPDAAPLTDEAFWADAEKVQPSRKVAISIRLDQDIVDAFKARGPGYQSRINAVLRHYVEHGMKPGDGTGESS